MDIAERLNLLISDVLEVDPAAIGPDSGLGMSRNWDSLAHLRIMTAIEEEFGVQFTMQQIGELTSLSAILDRLEPA